MKQQVFSMKIYVIVRTICVKKYDFALILPIFVCPLTNVEHKPNVYWKKAVCGMEKACDYVVIL